MVKDFSIIEKTYLHLIDESGLGPNATLINNYCDASVQGFVLDAAAPGSTLNAVNTPITAFNFGNYSDQAQAAITVLSTTNFQGTARFENAVQWGGNYLDFSINGGDVGVGGFHSDNGAARGSVVNGGVLHFNNASLSVNGNPVYNVTFGTGAGLPGKTNEFIDCYAYSGCGMFNLASNNPVNCWNDYALGTYALDRKSTRLNSSHLGISYAVFCLKKTYRSTAGRVPRLSGPWSPPVRPHTRSH